MDVPTYRFPIVIEGEVQIEADSARAAVEMATGAIVRVGPVKLLGGATITAGGEALVLPPAVVMEPDDHETFLDADGLMGALLDAANVR